MAVGFSTGLIIISLAGGFNVELFSFLFGSILTIDQTDLIIVSILGMSTILILGIFYKELLSITFDEEGARLIGIPVRSLSFSLQLAGCNHNRAFNKSNWRNSCRRSSSIAWTICTSNESLIQKNNTCRNNHRNSSA